MFIFVSEKVNFFLVLQQLSLSKNTLQNKYSDDFSQLKVPTVAQRELPKLNSHGSSFSFAKNLYVLTHEQNYPHYFHVFMHRAFFSYIHLIYEMWLPLFVLCFLSSHVFPSLAKIRLLKMHKNLWMFYMRSLPSESSFKKCISSPPSFHAILLLFLVAISAFVKQRLSEIEWLQTSDQVTCVSLTFESGKIESKFVSMTAWIGGMRWQVILFFLTWIAY